MDLNQLYFDHQIALMRANATPSDRLRAVHSSDAGHIAARIEGIHRASGAYALRNWESRHVSRAPLSGRP